MKPKISFCTPPLRCLANRNTGLYWSCTDGVFYGYGNTPNAAFDAFQESLAMG